jgi:hypothetical protein
MSSETQGNIKNLATASVHYQMSKFTFTIFTHENSFKCHSTNNLRNKHDLHSNLLYAQMLLRKKLKAIHTDKKQPESKVMLLIEYHSRNNTRKRCSIHTYTYVETFFIYVSSFLWYGIRQNCSDAYSWTKV